MRLGKLEVDGPALNQLCKQWGVHKLEAFGSVLREDFGDESDVDLLVTFLPGRKPKLFGLVEFQEQLQTLLARRVDLAEPGQLKWVIRDGVLREAQVVYAT